MSSLRDRIEDVVFARFDQNTATERLVDDLSALMQAEIEGLNGSHNQMTGSASTVIQIGGNIYAPEGGLSL